MILVPFLFTYLISANTIADLVPPYEATTPNRFGIWEFNGFALIQEDLIMISPPVQFSKGSAWTNLEFPDVDWSVQFDLGISQGTVGGGFGIWFVDKYGAEGTLFGGPNQFRGIGITAKVKAASSDPEKTEINFKILQDHGSLVFHEASDSDATVYLPSDNKRIFLRVSFESGYMTFESMNQKENKWEKLSKILVKVDISKNYLGITAQSDQYTSRFDLHSVNFSVDLVSERNDAGQLDHKSTGHYSPSHTLKLRNPKFVKTLVEMGKLEEKPDAESDASNLLDIVRELSLASFDAASYTDVNYFVQNTLLPYMGKWHKRSLKIVDEIQNARNIYGLVWNYTHEMINNFKEDIEVSASKTSEKIQNLREVLLSEAEVEQDEEQNRNGKVIVISLNTNDFDPVIIMLYASVGELIIFLSYSMFFNSQKNRNYLP